MTVPACGLATCPVPAPPSPAVVTAEIWPAGIVVHRGHKTAHPLPDELVPGVGRTRFAPLYGVHHAYVASSTFAALLESALHDARPPNPRIRVAVLSQWMASAVVLTRPMRLADLRDPALARLGVTRAELVSTIEAHYPCTRRWASALCMHGADGRPVDGIVWDSRQVELHRHAIDLRPALADVLAAAKSEVAVLWASPSAPRPIALAPGSLGAPDRGPGWTYVADLAALFGITVL